MINNKKNCIVIGAGIAGIAVALRLKIKGYDVTVLESNPFPGGKLHDFYIDDFRFDAGPSLFTMPQYIDELFELAGEKPENNFQYFKLKNSCNYFFSDGTNLNCPSNPVEFARLLEMKLNENSSDVLKYLKNSERLYKITAPVFLEKSLHKISSYFSYSALKGILNFRVLNIFKSMNFDNQSKFKNPKTIQFFNRFATYNGSNPYKAPATLNVIPHLEFGFGIWFPVHGMYSITESLYQLCLRKGVKFEFSVKVSKINHLESKVTGVETKDKCYHSDIVVCNMDINNAYKYLLQDLNFPKSIALAESSSSAVIFYWGIGKTFKNLDLHNVFFSSDYSAEFKAIFEHNSISEDPTIYINISSKYKPDDAPANCENWFVMVNAPANSGQNWEELVQKTRQKVLEKLTSILGENIEKLILKEKILSPPEIESKTFSHKGALYGSSSNKIISAFLRHSNFSTPVKNLYFCGGSVHPGGGIPLCLLSARIVAGLIKPT